MNLFKKHTYKAIATSILLAGVGSVAALLSLSLFSKTAEAAPGSPNNLSCTATSAGGGAWNVHVEYSFTHNPAPYPGGTPYALGVQGSGDGTAGATPEVGPVDFVFHPTHEPRGLFTASIYSSYTNEEMVAGCTSSGGGNPPGVALTASPTSGIFPSFAGVSWSTSDSPTSCTAGGEWSGSKSTSGGSETVGYPAVGDHTYTLTCSNDSGATSDSATITITPPGPSVSLTASPNPVSNNTATTLSWNSDYTNNCTATAGPGFNTSGYTIGSDQSSALTTGTLFSISCDGSNGTVTDDVYVGIAGVFTCSLSPSPATISAGSSVVATTVGGNGTHAWTATGGVISGSGNSVSIRYDVAGTYAVSVTTSTAQATTCGSVSVVGSGTAPTCTGVAPALTDVPVVGDYDGDGKDDPAVWANGTWNIVNSSNGYNRVQAWGSGSAPYYDFAAPGDYDGDQKADLAVWRSSTGIWYIIYSSTGATVSSTPWGLSTDKAAPGDYDGDGKTDYAVWRPSTGVWYVWKSSDGAKVAFGTLGNSTDVPVPGDYDGDGKTDMAVWRPGDGNWYVNRSSTATVVTIQLGVSTDVPVPGDYDGDGKTDQAVWKQQGADSFKWVVKQSSNLQTVTNTAWGSTAAPYYDAAAQGDYDGDGKTDQMVWRRQTGMWYLIKSSNGAYQYTSWIVSAPESSYTTATSGTFYAYAYGVTNATSVYFPTWGDTGGQDDIIWYPGTNLGGGVWRASIDLGVHKSGNPEYGTMNVHIYMNGGSYANQWCGVANFVRGRGPLGMFDFANCTYLQGWVFDYDAPSTSINVQLFKDAPMGSGGTYVGTYSTLMPPDGVGEARPDVNTAYAAYGVTGVHGFNFPTPASLKDGIAHSLYFYGVNNTVVGQNTLLISSPRSITCALPPPTVTLRANGSSSITITSPGSPTLSWTTENNPTSCTASLGWSGSKAVNGGGEIISSPPIGNNSYTLTCTNASGSAQSTATVQVNAPPIPGNVLPSNQDVVSVRGESLSYSATDGAAQAVIGNRTIAEGDLVGFAVHIRNDSGSGTISGDIEIVDTLSNLAPPDKNGWNADDPGSDGYIDVRCNGSMCAGYEIMDPVYDVGTKKLTILVRSTGGTLTADSYISVFFKAIPQGPSGSTANIFRFLADAKINYTDPVNGASSVDCSGGAPLCPLRTPPVLFFRNLSVPFLREVQ